MSSPSQRSAIEESTSLDRYPHTSLRREEEHNGGITTTKLVWIGVGVVVGLMLAKQFPQARRYMRLESM